MSKTVTFRDLLAFAEKKDPAAVADMSETCSTDKCGCLMIQYGKEELKIPDEFDVGYSLFGSGKYYLEHSIYKIFSYSLLGQQTIFTYAEIVEFLKVAIDKQAATH